MLVKTKSGEVLDLKTGQAMRLIQSGEAVACEPKAEPKDEHKSDLGNGRKENSRSDVAGSDRGKPKRT